MLIPSISFAATEEGITLFRDALNQYHACKFADSAEKFARARTALPALGDYALYYQAKALDELKAYAASEEALKELQRAYPDSPIKAESMALLIRVLKDSHDDDRLLKELEKYTASYPSDMDARFLHATLLKRAGQGEKASEIFKDIYIRAGHLAKDSSEQIDTAGLSAEELIARAGHLIDAAQYDEAESTLRKAMQSVPLALKAAATEKLAYCLFKQKKYTESAPLYQGLGQGYNTARSFLRAGKIEEFEKTLKPMVASHEPKAAELLISMGEEKRRAGHTEDAIGIFMKVSDIAPTMKEDAIWRMGWTIYTAGKYKEASEIFSGLYDTYKVPRYMYWKARSLEHAGERAGAEATFARVDDNGFYGLMVRISKKAPALTASERKPSSSWTRTPDERIDTLVQVGLTEEAARELVRKTGQLRDDRQITEAAYRLKELGRYREAIAVTSKLQDTPKPDEVLYPLAYWQIIERTAAKYNMDPFLVLSVIREESRFDPDAFSPAGAIGLMQLMPQTAKRTALSLDIKGIGDKLSIMNAENNIKMGVHYLSTLIKEFNSVPRALAAYNAGSDKVRSWGDKARKPRDPDEFVEDIPFNETRIYVKNILTSYYRYRMYPQFSWALGAM